MLRIISACRFLSAASPLFGFHAQEPMISAGDGDVNCLRNFSQGLVTYYVVTQPAREIFLTREEKYIAKVTIDTFIQRLGDATAPGANKMIETLLLQGPSAVAICALPWHLDADKDCL